MPPSSTLRVGLIGDRDTTHITAHRAIEQALPLAAESLGVDLHYQWLPTEALASADLAGLHGLWCVPGSPYRDTQAVLDTIRIAREQALPFLGTCGGFQHALLEYALNVLGWADAEHAELPLQGGRAIIAPLSCALLETRQSIRLQATSRIAGAYGTTQIEEGYQCRYGLNPEYAPALLDGQLRASGWDEHGEVRAVELQARGFFVATLFQPERAALQGQVPPLVSSWLQACAEGA